MSEEKFYHFSIYNFSRSKGHSAAQKGSYRTGTDIVDPLTNRNHSQSAKGEKEGIENVAILNECASEKFKDPAYFFSKIDEMETRKNSRLFSDAQFSLFRDLDIEDNKEVAIRFAKEFHEKYETPVMISFHKMDSDNPHVHMSFYERKIEGDHFSKNKLRGEIKSKNFLRESRKLWSEVANNYFDEKHLDWFIDYRSYSERGLEKTPQQHVNPKSDIESGTLQQEKKLLNKEIKKFNKRSTEREDLTQDIKERKSISDFKMQVDLNSTQLYFEEVDDMLNIVDSQKEKQIDTLIELNNMKEQKRRELFDQKMNQDNREQRMENVIKDEISDYLGNQNADHLQADMLRNGEIRIESSANIQKLDEESFEKQLYHKYFGDYDNVDIDIDRHYDKDEGTKTEIGFSYSAVENEEELKNRMNDFENDLKLGYIEMQDKLHSRHLENDLYQASNVNVNVTDQEVTDALSDNKQYKKLRDQGHEVMSAAEYEKQFNRNPSYGLDEKVHMDDELKDKAKQTLTGRQYRAASLLNTTEDPNKFKQYKQDFEEEHDVNFTNYLTEDTKQRFEKEIKDSDLEKTSQEIKNTAASKTMAEDTLKSSITEDFKQNLTSSEQENFQLTDEKFEQAKNAMRQQNQKGNQKQQVEGFRPSAKSKENLQYYDELKEKQNELENHKSELEENYQSKGNVIHFPKQNEKAYEEQKQNNSQQSTDRKEAIKQRIQQKGQDYETRKNEKSDNYKEINNTITKKANNIAKADEEINRLKVEKNKTSIFNRNKRRQLSKEIRNQYSNKQTNKLEKKYAKLQQKEVKKQNKQMRKDLKQEKKRYKKLDKKEAAKNLKNKPNSTVGDAYDTKIKNTMKDHDNINEDRKLQKDESMELKQGRKQAKNEYKMNKIRHRMEKQNQEKRINAKELEITNAIEDKKQMKFFEFDKKEAQDEVINSLQDEKKSLIQDKKEARDDLKQSRQNMKDTKKELKSSRKKEKTQKMQSELTKEKGKSLLSEKKKVKNLDQSIDKDKAVQFGDKNDEVQVLVNKESLEIKENYLSDKQQERNQQQKDGLQLTS